MYFLEKIKIDLAAKINKALGSDLVQASHFVYPPTFAKASTSAKATADKSAGKSDKTMGDLSLACFDIAKMVAKNPAETAGFLAKKIKNKKYKAKAAGPYLNFTISSDVIAGGLKEVGKNKYGWNKSGDKKKIMIEFAHPNTHKAFHVGHLRNILTGEAIAKILTANGYKVIRANYQGDVGLHIAKCLWGIINLEREYKEAKSQGTKVKSEFLGKAYSFGSKNYEENENAKKEIIELNKKIYNQDRAIKSIYNTTRKWSLGYFKNIYKRVNTKFDRLYFESEVFHRGREIVLENMEKGIFIKSDGAVIFEAEKYGLHNRVFINSEGNSTYEAKDLGLAEIQFKEYNPEKIIHVVSTEQSEYFKVIIKAIEIVMPQTIGREIHKSYGWVRLKEGKMSSRLGNVVLGEWLLDEAFQEVKRIMSEGKEIANKEEIAKKVSVAAVKYSILSNGVDKDISFNMNESVSFSGNSGPYIQYTYARANSILKKADQSVEEKSKKVNYANLREVKEKNLIFKLLQYPEIVAKAGIKYDPSEIAKYLFEMAQMFNDYYHSIQVLGAEEEVKKARLGLIVSTMNILQNGLYLLGIDTVEEM